MKLRIGKNDNGFWVEQKRWYGIWKKCREYSEFEIIKRELVPYMRSYRAIKFCDRSDILQGKHLFKTFEEAQKFSEAFWHAWSILGRKAYRLTKGKPGKTNYFRVVPEREHIKRLLKEGENGQRC